MLIALTMACRPAPAGRSEITSPPGPPHDEAVSFHSGLVTLAGTFVVPSGEGPHPAVLLFHGSGPEPRYLDVAHWWAEHGVAALTYDKRGVGESTGDYRDVPFMDLHLDGLAGVAWLKARHDVDASRIGVWGLSQGGWLGPLAATKSPDIHFVVAVSGPGVSPGEQMVFFFANRLRERGVPEPDIQRVTTLRRLAWTAASEGRDLDHVRAQVTAARAAATDAAVKDQLATLAQQIAPPPSIWIAQEMNYDPVQTLRQLKVPALFLFAGDDTLVPVQESIDIIRRTLTEAHHPDFQIDFVPGADHAMYVVGPDGSRQQSREYLADMARWIQTHVTR